MSQAQSTTREPARARSSRRRMDMTVRPRGLGGARAALKMAARAATGACPRGGVVAVSARDGAGTPRPW